MKITLFPIKFAAAVSGAPGSPTCVKTKYEVRSNDPTKFLRPGQQYVVESEQRTLEDALAFARSRFMHPSTQGNPDLALVQSEINLVTGEITLLLDKQDVIIDREGNVRLGHRDECMPLVGPEGWDRLMHVIGS